MFVTVGTTLFDKLIASVSSLAFLDWIAEKGYDNGSVLWPYRVSLTGLERSPGTCRGQHFFALGKIWQKCSADVHCQIACKLPRANSLAKGQYCMERNIIALEKI